MARAKKEAAPTPEERLQAALVPDWEWPYKLPENWCWTYLGTPIHWGSGGTPSRKNPEFYDGDIPWIKTGELNDEVIVQTEEHISQEAVRNSSAKLFPINTVAIAMYGATIGKTGIIGIPATTNQACACGVCSSAVYYKYLFYYAQSQKEAFIKKGKGGAQPNISQEIIKGHEFPLAPLAEQQRIVDRIESLFAKLDEAKEKAQTVLDSFETRKAAILHKAFTGELIANWREEHRASIDEWQSANMSYFLRDMETKRPDGEYFRYIDIDAIDNKHQVVREPKLLLTKEAPSRASRAVETGSVLFSMVRPYLRNIALVTADLSDCIASTGFYVCNCRKEKLIPKYLYWMLCSNDIIDYLMQFMKGDNSPSIRKDDLLNMFVEIPNVDEQDEIVRILDDLFAKEQQAKEAAEAVLEKIDLMKKAILARAFRGELGTNDPNDEPAVELVKKIV